MKKLSTSLIAAALALAFAGPAAAITVTVGTWADAAATVGETALDGNDWVVKPGCDCEAGPNSGFVLLKGTNGRDTRVHYEKIEGKPIATTDGTAVGTVISVQNENATGPIVLLVQVDAGVLGAVERINLRRNAVVWDGKTAIINTTFDDLRASISAIGVAM